MGRIVEVLVCIWKVVYKNKFQRGVFKEDEGINVDNYCVKCYISKYIINFVIIQGISYVVGSVEVGKLVDLVIWDLVEFGFKFI